MNKLVLLTILLMVTGLSYAQKTRVKIKLNLDQEFEPKLFCYVDEIENNIYNDNDFIVKPVKIKDGEYIWDLDIKSPIYCTYVLNSHSQTFYLEPQKGINLEFNYELKKELSPNGEKKIKSVNIINIKTELEEEFNYLVKYSNIGNVIKPNDYILSEKYFKQLLKKEKTKAINNLNTYKVSEKFKQLELKRLEIIFNSKLGDHYIGYGWLNKKKHLLASDQLKKELIEIINKSEAYTGVLGSLYPFIKRLTQGILSSKIKLKQEAFRIKELNFFNTSIKSIRLRKYILKTHFKEVLRHLPSIESKELYNVYSTYFDKSFLRYIKKSFAKKRKEIKNKKDFEIKYKDLNNKSLSIKKFKGKYVFVDIWATWCKPCTEEIPFLKKIQKKYKDLIFLSVSIDKDRAKWKKFVQENKLKGYHICTDGDNSILKNLQLFGVPSFVVYDKKEKKMKVNVPRPSSKDIFKFLDSLK